jgi:hypothetical protein
MASHLAVTNQWTLDLHERSETETLRCRSKRFLLMLGHKEDHMEETAPDQVVPCFSSPPSASSPVLCCPHMERTGKGSAPVAPRPASLYVLCFLLPRVASCDDRAKVTFGQDPFSAERGLNFRKPYLSNPSALVHCLFLALPFCRRKSFDE